MDNFRKNTHLACTGKYIKIIAHSVVFWKVDQKLGPGWGAFPNISLTLLACLQNPKAAYVSGGRGGGYLKLLLISYSFLTCISQKSGDELCHNSNFYT